MSLMLFPRRKTVFVSGGLAVVGVLAVGLRLESLRPEPVLVATVPAFRLDDSTRGIDALPNSVLEAVQIPELHRVMRGQTLVALFEQLGLERRQANRATFAMQEHMDPRTLKAGAHFAVYRRADESVAKVVFPVDQRGEVLLRPAVDGWQSEWREYRIEERVRSVSGRLREDLSSAMHQAGAPYSLTTELADVLQWDLDFNRDLRQGDEFAVVYRGVWSDGRFQRVKNIEAAVYLNRGKALEAYRFGEGGSYYDGDGRPLRKQFLKSPLPFTRVTSRFSYNRLHPVLGIRRPHYGVDYGAPKGTPVRATANGSISFRGRTKGAGNMVRIRHPNGYETSYLHLSKFHRNSCKGCRVHQGDLIGYVGSTGLATAPHLDYRVKRNGRYMDPLKLPNAPAPPLTGDQLQQFLMHRDDSRRLLPKIHSEETRSTTGATGSAITTAP